MRGKKHFHKLTIEDVTSRSARLKEAEAAKAATEKVHTILVPVDKADMPGSSTVNYHRRGRLSYQHQDFIGMNRPHAQSANMHTRTRSGGGNNWSQSALQLRAELADLGSSQFGPEMKVVDSGDVI